MQPCRYAACPELRHTDPLDFVLAWMRGVLTNAEPRAASDFGKCFRDAGVAPGTEQLPAATLVDECKSFNTTLHVLRKEDAYRAMVATMGATTNDTLTVKRWYHGTSEASALDIIRDGVDFEKCNNLCGFGGGRGNWRSFYVGNDLRQAYAFAVAKHRDPAVLQCVWLFDAARRA